MKGLKVKCPSCGRICFETTDQFNPDAPPNGGMVRCLLQYQIDWLCSPTTPPSEMCCPECLAPLVIGGVLNVIMPAREAGEAFKDDLVIPKGALTDEDIKKYSETPGNLIPAEETNEALKQKDSSTYGMVAEKDGKRINPEDILKPPPAVFICDVCGKECKNQFGLNSHKKSHKTGGK